MKKNKEDKKLYYKRLDEIPKIRKSVPEEDLKFNCEFTWLDEIPKMRKIKKENK